MYVFSTESAYGISFFIIQSFCSFLPLNWLYLIHSIARLLQWVCRVWNLRYHGTFVLCHVFVLETVQAVQTNCMLWLWFKARLKQVKGVGSWLWDNHSSKELKPIQAKASNSRSWDLPCQVCRCTAEVHHPGHMACWEIQEEKELLTSGLKIQGFCLLCFGWMVWFIAGLWC